MASDLRAFDEVLPFPYNTVELKAQAACAACDVSFLTGVTNLDVQGLERSALALPTSVVELTPNHETKRVTVSGTENVTSLGVWNPNVTLSPCPKLEAVSLGLEKLSAKKLPLPIADMTTVSSLRVEAEYVMPSFRLPTQLTSLDPKLSDDAVDDAVLAPLTRLQSSTSTFRTTTRSTCRD